MKINNITIRGAIGFKKGLGVDVLTIDLKNKTGLVALSGPNGMGKTTLLELMSPFRTFASRKGAFRHHFFLRDSFIDTEFEFNGSEYKTIRKIDSDSDRAEAFIIKDGESVVNGKLKEYDEYIIDLFGSQALFYNSVFCAQNSGNLSDMTTGKIKELFVEFLRIERLAEYEKKSKEAKAYFQNKIDIVTGKIEALSTSYEEKTIVESEIGDLESYLEQDKIKIGAISLDIEMIEKEIDLLNEKKREHEYTLKTIEEKKKASVEIKSSISAKESEKSRNEVKKRSRLYDLEEEIRELEKVVSKKSDIFSASTKITELEKRKDYFSNCLECALDEMNTIDKDMKVVSAELKSQEDILHSLEYENGLPNMAKNLLDIESKIKSLESKADSLEKEKAGLENDFELRSMRQKEKELMAEISMAIDPDCKSKTCPALDIVDNAKKNLPILRSTIELRGNEINGLIASIAAELLKTNGEVIVNSEKLKTDDEKYSESVRVNDLNISEQQKIIHSLKKQDAGFASDYLHVSDIREFYRDSISIINNDISSLSELASKKNDVDLAESKIAQISDQIELVKYDFTDIDKKISDEMSKLKSDLLKIEIEIDSLESGIDAGLESKIKDKSESLSLSKSKLNRLNIGLSDMEKRLAVLESKKVEIDKRDIEISEKKNELSTYEKELSEWDYLRLACSKTGLQALEIDGATPLITAEANKLLEKSFGLDSQIKIVTLDPESGREVFDIKVIRDDGSEDDYANLSGGQKIWISSALSLGMTLVSKNKSGRDYKSIFMDERDGALDKEKAIDFIRLYRSVLETGGFETCLFISHNPDLVAMADHEIDFETLI